MKESAKSVETFMDRKFDEVAREEKKKKKLVGSKAGSWMKILDERTRLLMTRQTHAES